MIEWIQLQITWPAKEGATEAAALLVNRHLVACAQIMGPVDSFYRWQGQEEYSREWLLLCKTRKSLFDRVSQVVKGIHPYECPQLVAITLDCISPDYRNWLESQTEGE